MGRRPGDSSTEKARYYVLALGVIVVIGLALSISLPRAAQANDRQDEDPRLRAMISQVDESRIYQSTYDLQNFTTREYPSEGNERAGDYLHDRLAAIPGLEVEYGSDAYRNVIATLPGEGATSDGVVVVGVHYDSTSSDPEYAPGATDNAGGAAIVLELARVMSGYGFNHTVQFAFWNAEEDAQGGSRAYAAHARATSLEIPLYMNYDSSCYDPDGRRVLDVMYDTESEPFAELYGHYNSLYDIGFDLTYNVHECRSDHASFREAGYPAVTTHCEEHSPGAHTPGDTIDLVSPDYAARNARLGLLILSDTAEIRL